MFGDRQEKEDVHPTYSGDMTCLPKNKKQIRGYVAIQVEDRFPTQLLTSKVRLDFIHFAKIVYGLFGLALASPLRK